MRTLKEKSIDEPWIQQLLEHAKKLPNTGKLIHQDGSIYQGRLFELNGFFWKREKSTKIANRKRYCADYRRS